MRAPHLLEAAVLQQDEDVLRHAEPGMNYPSHGRGSRLGERGLGRGGDVEIGNWSGGWQTKQDPTACDSVSGLRAGTSKRGRTLGNSPGLPIVVEAADGTTKKVQPLLLWPILTYNPKPIDPIPLSELFILPRVQTVLNRVGLHVQPCATRIAQCCQICILLLLATKDTGTGPRTQTR